MTQTHDLDFVAPLFVPASRPEIFDKAATSGADAIILDLEDAVADEAKEEARKSLSSDFTSLPVLVRVNSISSPWHEEDIKAVSKLSLSAIVVPKAELSPEFEQLCSSLAEVSLPVIALVETAKGLADTRQLSALENVKRLIFGSIDFCADLGCAHTRETLLFARNELVLASRLNNILKPVDGVTTSLQDVQGITDDARYSCDLGFGGKLCIHPKHVSPTLNGFKPSEAEIEWANRVLEAGEGAVTVDGAMVDKPVRIRARNILKRK
ncbi:CoA ester lyase [Terasakiella sp. SH-1]|uniref:HpcH/HpaI aldolase/citrate lyase family protein n=1 Tax=Terasakiella sp. SH-1 TaxID=2560057 RepID=UPI00107452CC|nr:CoA ester lyase [Terasakiella sp. SH-1]